MEAVSLSMPSFITFIESSLSPSQAPKKTFVIHTDSLVVVIFV